MREITIDGLTIAQVELLDTMWAIDSYEDYEEWRAGLDTETKSEVDILQELILLETMEELLLDTSEADAVISKIQRKLT